MEKLVTVQNFFLSSLRAVLAIFLKCAGLAQFLFFLLVLNIEI